MSNESQLPRSAQIPRNMQRSIGPDKDSFPSFRVAGFYEHERVYAFKLGVSREYRLAIITLESREEHRLSVVKTKNALNAFAAEAAQSIIKQHRVRSVCAGHNEFPAEINSVTLLRVLAHQSSSSE